MSKYLAAYAGTAVVMIVLDLIWLGVIAKPMYQQGIGHLMSERPNIAVAVGFYAIYAAGVVLFGVSPQSGGSDWSTTLLMAALFGFFAYATYDLTNLATLRDWPWRLSVIDIAWGTFVSAAAAAGGKLAMDWALKP
jgi:uncharacterized membrane protein